MKTVNWRTVILVWLMLLLPLQGFAAVSMWHCVQNNKLLQTAQPQSSASESHCEQMHQPEQPEQAAASATSFSDTHPLKQAQADHCQGKSLCCIAALMPVAGLSTPGLAIARIPAATPLPAYHSAELSLPERPPRL